MANLAPAFARFCSAVVSVNLFLAFAQSPETKVLGGPCATERMGPGWHDLVTRHGHETSREAAVELARQIVRGNCGNEYWWYKFIGSLVELGRMQDAVSAIDVMYQRKINGNDAELQKMPKLVASAEYRSSTVAKNLARDRAALKTRRADAERKIAGSAKPPEQYVAKGACPFECCGFGTWTVTQDTSLYRAPGSTEVVGSVKKGEKVQALTGEVHLRPTPVLVRYGTPLNGMVYLLDNLGEGMGHIWKNGKVEEAETHTVREECTFPGPECWGEFVRPQQKQDAVWWIQIRMKGWTREADHFTGADRCG